jgi:RNA polymerase subunit RPABC4/transcription elongation factor Spt4
MINISVKDGASVDDYVMITITVEGTNDPPMLDKVDGDTVVSGDTIDRGKVTVGDYDNFTIEASDVDMDDVLSGPSGTTAITITKDGMMWNVSFNPAEADVGNVTLNFTITDLGLDSDYVMITWQVESGEPPIPPNEDPTIGITSSGGKITIGDMLEVEGTWSDAESATVTILMASRTPMDAQLGFTGAPEDYEFSEVSSAAGETMTVNADGTWKYSVDTGVMLEAFEEALAALEALLGSAVDDSILYGTYTFYFMAEDEDMGASSVVSVAFEIEKKDDDGGDDDKTLSIGLFDYDILILLIVIIVVILVVVMMMKKKKKVEEPAEEPPAAPMACTACGAEIPPGAETCPACGAAAPVPPVAGPVACTACGAEIPPDTPNCPACGAPAPPPAEAPPVETICECGATIPAGSPTCPACGRQAPAPLPEAPMNCPACGNQIPPGSPTCPACGAAAPAPEAPAEGMPPEGMAPPGVEGAMAPEGAPPEGMAPPPAAPPEQPPAEGAPPAQMVACPTCGAQIAVGQTPCPGCGTALNWG